MSKQTPCVPCRNKNGKLPSHATNAMKIARRMLEERDRPRQPGEVCRHRCENDSMAPNGFVCSEHTVWGTHSENMMDKTPEARAAHTKTDGPSKGGKATALVGGQSKGGKAPNGAFQKPVKCTHCGTTTNLANHAQYHGDKCKSPPLNALIFDDTNEALDLIYSRTEAV